MYAQFMVEYKTRGSIGTIDFPSWVKITKCKTHTHTIVLPRQDGVSIYHARYMKTRNKTHKYLHASGTCILIDLEKVK